MSRLLLPGVLSQTFGIPAPDQIITDGRDWMWWDLSDLSTLAQNTDGTGAVTVGDPVGYMEDRSGNGHTVTAAGGTGERPLLQQTGGGLYYLDFDGANDALLSGDIAWVGDYLAVAGFSLDSLSDYHLIDADQNSGARRKAQLLRLNGAGELLTLGFNDAGGLSADDSGVTPTAGVAFVASGYNDSSTIESWVNRSSDGSTSFSGTPRATTSIVGVGAQANGSNATNGKFFGGVVVNGSSTTSERNQLEDYIASKSGVTL